MISVSDVDLNHFGSAKFAGVNSHIYRFQGFLAQTVSLITHLKEQVTILKVLFKCTRGFLNKEIFVWCSSFEIFLFPYLVLFFRFSPCLPLFSWFPRSSLLFLLSEASFMAYSSSQCQSCYRNAVCSSKYDIHACVLLLFSQCSCVFQCSVSSFLLFSCSLICKSV